MMNDLTIAFGLGYFLGIVTIIVYIFLNETKW